MNIIIGVFLFILGTVLASFIGVVIYRVPNKMSIVKPDSFCPSCKTPIKWYDNIPLLSYLILGGKCRYCKAKIGINSFLLELSGGILFLLAFLMYHLSVELIFVELIICILLVIFGIDFNHKFIYDWSLIIFFVLTCGLLLYVSLVNKEVPIKNFIGFGVGFFSFLFIKLIAYLITKRDCLGTGDVILMGIGGFLLGWQNWLLSVLVGSVLGSVIELILIKLKKRSKEEEIPFGPYLVIGILFSLLFGEVIINWYLSLVI